MPMCKETFYALIRVYQTNKQKKNFSSFISSHKPIAATFQIINFIILPLEIVTSELYSAILSFKFDAIKWNPMFSRCDITQYILL